MTGLELKELRKKNGLTQKEFANIIKFNFETIKKWETNQRAINAGVENYIKLIFRLIPLPDLKK